MPINTVNLTDGPFSNEYDKVLDLLKHIEGEHPNHYDVLGISTIGYGFALLVQNGFELVV